MAAATTAGVLDNRRVPCALGLIRLRQTMDGIAPGDELIVLSRDRFAPYEIPLWAERAGHELLAVDRGGIWPFPVHRVHLRKRDTGTKRVETDTP